MQHLYIYHCSALFVERTPPVSVCTGAYACVHVTLNYCLECIGQLCDRGADFRCHIDTCPESWSLSSPFHMSAMAGQYMVLLDASVTNMRRLTGDVITAG